MAAMIAVQDRVQHVQESQLWFLQCLLGKLVLIAHTFTTRSLQFCGKQSQGFMHPYLAGQPRYCSNDMVPPGTTALWLYVFSQIGCTKAHIL